MKWLPSYVRIEAVVFTLLTKVTWRNAAEYMVLLVYFLTSQSKTDLELALLFWF